MLTALNKQLTQDATDFNSVVDTIYFGGGTPSLLSADELKSLLLTIQSNYTLSKKVEITLEANPDDISLQKAKKWLALGINRLSIGVQSFFQENLTTMNRAHNAEEAEMAIHAVNEAGFKNYSVDLMFALPDLSDETWIQNLQKVIDLKVPHLSCYNLTIEEQTALNKLISKKKITPLSEDTSTKQFTITIDKLEEAGYEQYEISNYCLPGMESRHNSAYWEQKEYLGIGPAAHSFLKEERTHNVAHNMNYIKAMENNVFKREIETRTDKNKFNEFVMTRLRTKKGIIEDELITKYNAYFELIQDTLDKQVQLGSIVFKDGAYRLTKKGKYIADQVAMELFV